MNPTILSISCTPVSLTKSTKILRMKNENPTIEVSQLELILTYDSELRQNKCIWHIDMSLRFLLLKSAVDDKSALKDLNDFLSDGWKTFLTLFLMI